jgi:hypothetical protein
MINMDTFCRTVRRDRVSGKALGARQWGGYGRYIGIAQKVKDVVGHGWIDVDKGRVATRGWKPVVSALRSGHGSSVTQRWLKMRLG